MRNLDEQMDLFSPLEPVPINPITGDPELTAPYDAELLAKSKEAVKTLPRDVGVGALTSIPVGAGDTVDFGSAFVPSYKDVVEGKIPIDSRMPPMEVLTLGSIFDILSDAGVSRDNAEKLIKEVTGIELKGNPGEFIGEVIGLPAAGLANAGKSIISAVAKHGNKFDDVVAEAKSLFRTASGGDDFDGMAPATVTDTPPVAAQTDQVFDTAPKLPDTSVSPNMIGESTAIGQEAIADYERVISQGMSKEDAYKNTGVYVGADGKHRYDLLPIRANLKEEFQPDGLPLSPENYTGETYDLDEVLDFESLFNAYEDEYYDAYALDFVTPSSLRDIKVTFEDADDFLGRYSYQNDAITLDTELLQNPDKLLSVLMHEVQHAVQRREGFTSGSNEVAFFNRAGMDLDGSAPIPDLESRDELFQFQKSELEGRSRAITTAESRLAEFFDQSGEVLTDDDRESLFFISQLISDVNKKSDAKYFDLTQRTSDNYDVATIIKMVESGGDLTDDPEALETVNKVLGFLAKVQSSAKSSTKANTIMQYALQDVVIADYMFDLSTQISDQAALLYRRKYGELEAKLVEERLGAIRKMQAQGVDSDEIARVMRKRYPPVNMVVRDQLIKAAGASKEGMSGSFPSNVPDGGMVRFVPEDYGLLEGAEAGMPPGLMPPGGITSAAAKETSDEMISVFPKPERMFPEGDRPKGGDYLNPETGEVLSGRNVSSANIKINPDGKPSFKVSNDNVETVGSTGKGKSNIRVNLFKKKAGWKWDDAPADYKNIETLVSVEHKGKHYYTVETDFTSGVNLKKYPDSKTEPRLRPTLIGSIELGEPVGTISVRGKQHPVYSQIKTFNKGGVVPMDRQMDMFQEGGLEQDGGTKDPISGNDVPPGSTQEEVRDDIPAQLSEGEFVFPADVVRYIGLEKLMQMRQEAKMGLAMMERMGQMGNSEEAVVPDDIPFELSDLDITDDPVEMQEGGMVPNPRFPSIPPGIPTPRDQVYGIAGYTPAAAPTTGVADAPQQAASQQFIAPEFRPVQAAVPTMGATTDLPEFTEFTGGSFGAPDEYRTYRNDAGQEVRIAFKNGEPLQPIPEGYKYVDPEAVETEEVTTTPTTVETTMVTDSGDGDERRRQEEEAKYGPGGGRVGLGGYSDGTGRKKNATIVGVSFGMPDGFIPGAMGAIGTAAGLLSGGDIPEGATATFFLDGETVTVDAGTYNSMKAAGFTGDESDSIISQLKESKRLSDRSKDMTRDFMSKSEEERRKETAAAVKANEERIRARREKAEEIATRAAEIKEQQAKARRELEIQQTRKKANETAAEAIIRNAQRAERQERERQEDRDSGGSGQTIQERADDFTADRIAEYQSTGFSGRGFAEGGLASKPKPKAKKKMKRGGLASKK